MRSHLLKTVDPHFGNVKSGRKTFEFRKNDRDYRVGDILVLRHWVKDPEENKWFYYPGEVLYREVTHTLQGGVFGAHGALSPDYCIMSLRDFAPPLPVLVFCPRCQVQHIDVDEWAIRPHRKHLCALCEHIWKLADVPTVGVAELPRPEAPKTELPIIDADA